MKNSPGCKSCFARGSGFTMHAKSAISPEQNGKWQEVRVSADGTCTEDVKEHTCSVKPVGFWKPLRHVTTKQTYTETFGTSRSQTKLSAEEYASEVVVGVRAGGGWSNGDAPGLHGSIEVNAEFRNEWGQSYSTEISTTVDTETTFEVLIDDDQQLGKYLWQFAQNNYGSCGDSETLFQKFVFTAGRSHTPCCYPGHCTDAHIFSCDWCAKGYMVPNASSRCKEGSPPCPKQVYQLENVNAFAVVEELSEGGIREQPCPAGYNGVIAAQCADTRMRLTESCSRVSPPVGETSLTPQPPSSTASPPSATPSLPAALSISKMKTIHLAITIAAVYQIIAAFA